MITSVTIKNLKRFEAVKVPLGETIVLAGPNNSGKTTAIQALSVWRLALQKWLEKRGEKSRSKAKRRTGVPITRRDMTVVPVREVKLLWNRCDVMAGANQPRLIEILVEGTTRGNDWKFGMELQYQGPEMFYCRPMRVAPDSEERMEVPDEARELTVVHLPPLAGLRREEERLDEGAQNVRIGEGRAGDIIRNLLWNVAEKSEEDWKQLKEHVAALFQVELLRPEYIAATGEIVVEYHDGLPRKNGRNPHPKLDIASGGSGFQQVLLLLAFLYARAGAVLMFDEPDAHLEIVRQRDVYDLLKRLATERGAQLIVATHSEVIFDDTDHENIVAFLEEPHRLTSKQEARQFRKSLSEIRSADYLLAEQRGRVLYVEDYTDIEILRAWAHVLSHPALKFLESPFAVYVGNVVTRARDHFYGLRAAYPKLMGALLVDQTDAELHTEGALWELMWRRREIENYLLVPEAVLRLCAAEIARLRGWQPNANLFLQPEREKAREILGEFVPPIVFGDPLTDTPFLTETKVSVWSYFHALRESDSPMARHFVVIAPNLTVFERLKEDFGNGIIFDKDPLIPVAWRGDWNLSVVLQDEASGAATGGTLYLTNIHRLYDISRRRARGDAETYEWMGPPVSRAKALDTGEALRARITAHPRIVVLNDEAHHLWDPDSAWNEAIAYLQDTIAHRTGGGIVAQLDFSATPKDNHGRIFPHVVCDTPLGEAVDAGIVKTPIIGRGQGLVERPSQDASEKFQPHLLIGYERWHKSKEEWEASGKKPLMFVMTEDTEAADQIARRLNTDPMFADLNGKTVNLHTRLKGKIKWVGGKRHGYPEFVESESDISEEDLKELRKLSRELDSGTSPYQCIVSVLMLREGWDVKNVTTIVPLRPYTSQANILPEQTLGRGLRRMTPPGEAAELVTVVEHPAFVSFYQTELSQEGLPIEVVDVEDVPKTTVTIFPDKEHKDLTRLDLVILSVSGGYTRTATLEGLTIEDVRAQFSRYTPLPLGEARAEEIQYEGRHLLTNEVVEQMKVRLPLLESGIGAVSFYREGVEHITGLRGTHTTLAPLIEKFLTEILFEEKVTLFDPRLLGRLADPDVREHIRATFVPLILKRTTTKQERKPQGAGVSVTTWKPFQVTHSANQPAIPADRTPFNLVPCNRKFEEAMTQFLDRATDVAAFCKNAGPQALRIDYLTESGRLALYTPDFIVRLTDGSYVLPETKGRVDRDVPLKARAAVAWCEAASQSGVKWQYLYVPQGTFESFSGDSVATLLRTCAPALQGLLRETVEAQLTLPFGEAGLDGSDLSAFIAAEGFARLPSRYQKGIQQAVKLFRFLENQEDVSFAPVFTSLLGPLDEAAKGVLLDFLSDDVPDDRAAQRDFFDPDLSHLPTGEANFHQRQAANLRRTLVDHNGLMPMGLLRWCLDCTRNSRRVVGGVFQAVRARFADAAKTDLYEVIDRIYNFRNEYIAHQERELSDPTLTRQALGEWANGLYRIWQLHHGS